MRLPIALAAATCLSCSTESSPTRPPSNAPVPECTAGATRPCTCSSGASGMQSCSTGGALSACQCAPEPMDVDNPDPGPGLVDAGGVMEPTPQADCSPGLYLGTYECDLGFFGIPVPLAGDVSFNLSIDETRVEGECDPSDEFCPDLVISENGGTLFGLAGLWGFETMLEGALDCTTGEFRATGFGGRWGTAVSMDPNDPDALWTVEEPPIGRFDGTLDGTYTKSPSETVAGEWTLNEPDMGVTCIGPFTVTLQP